MRQIFSNQFDHWATQDDGVAHVAHTQVAQPHPVLHQQGLVEPVARDQSGFLFRRRPDLNHVVDRIPGNPVDDQENDHRYRQKNRNQQQQPPEAIVQQTVIPSAGIKSSKGCCWPGAPTLLDFDVHDGLCRHFHAANGLWQFQARLAVGKALRRLVDRCERELR